MKFFCTVKCYMVPSLQSYLSWLRAEVRLKKVASPSSSQGGRQGPPAAANARYPGGRSHGSSESEQSEDDSQVDG